MKRKGAGRRARRIAVIYNIDFVIAAAAEKGDSLRTLEANSEVARAARKIADILEENGDAASLIEVNDSLDFLPEKLRGERIEAVFNLVESIGNVDAREPEFPALLERLGVPYTGNSPAPLILAQAKDEAKRRLAACGVPFPRGVAVDDPDELRPEILADLAFPLFVKPARTDASIGIDQESVVRDAAALRERLQYLRTRVRCPLLVEEFLPGREINVAIFPEPHNGVYAPTEIDFSGYPPDLVPIVTYNCKWRPDSPEYNAFSKPAAGRLPPALLDEALRLARAAFLAIGGDGYGRVDMRLDAQSRPKVIDINPNNDLDCDAGTAIAARGVGVEYPALILGIAAHASLKENHAAAPRASRRPRAARSAAGSN
jgi:D-alanine-D-alanine ligase